MKKVKILFVLLVLIILSDGCTSDNDKNVQALTRQGEQLSNKFYKSLVMDDSTNLYNLFSNQFYTASTKSDLKIILRDIRVKYGKVRSWNLVENKYSITIQNGKREKMISCIFRVLYSSGFTSKETFKFLVENNTKEIRAIDGYFFDSFGSED